MEVVCVNIKKFRGVENKKIYLNSNYKIDFNENDDTLDLNNMTITKNNNFSLYHKKNIIDSYLVIGNNGTGKSSLFDLLRNNIGTNENDLCDYQILFNENDENPVYSIFEHNKKKFFLYEENDENSVTKKGVDENIKNKKFSNFYSIKSNDGKFCFDFKGKKTKKISGLPTQEGIFKFICECYQKKILNFKADMGISLIKKFGYYRPVKRWGQIDTWDDIVGYFVHDYVDRLIKLYNESWKVKKLMNSPESISSDSYKGLVELIKTDLYKNNIDETITKYIKEKGLKIKYDSDLLKQIKTLLEIAKDIPDFKGDNLHYKLSDFISEDGKIIDFYYQKCLELLKLNTAQECFFELKYSCSTGEQSLIEMSACVWDCVRYIEETNQDKENNVFYLLLDEIDQNLHPEWSRKLYSYLEEVINGFNTNNKFYIYIATHSPYLISDFTIDHIINLDNKAFDMNMKSFGANIYNILKNGMFLDNPMGEFAYKKIKKVHEILANAKDKNEVLEKLKEEKVEDDKELIYFIENIGESLIRNQLKKIWDNLDFKISYFENELKEKNKEELIDIIRGLCNVENK